MIGIKPWRNNQMKATKSLDGVMVEDMLQVIAKSDGLQDPRLDRPISSGSSDAFQWPVRR